MLTRRMLLSAAAAAPAAAIFTRPAMAAEPSVFAVDGVAIRGADPVAFFTDAAPVIGSADHALMWEGATWHFASADNMELFMANPTSYAPQYGGYCAFAMSKGYLATSVPEAWTVHDGKLYLNYSVNVRQVWSEDIPGNIGRADMQWPAILG
ncbi:MAG: YHS domain protein [Octadecabacter sp.]|nr:YHS domain protein [Octadecabacter sp.]